MLTILRFLAFVGSPKVSGSSATAVSDEDDELPDAVLVDEREVDDREDVVEDADEVAALLSRPPLRRPLLFDSRLLAESP